MPKCIVGVAGKENSTRFGSARVGRSFHKPRTGLADVMGPAWFILRLKKCQHTVDTRTLDCGCASLFRIQYLPSQIEQLSRSQLDMSF